MHIYQLPLDIPTQEIHFNLGHVGVKLAIQIYLMYNGLFVAVESSQMVKTNSYLPV